MSTPLERLSAAGVSVWLDDLSRSRLDSGSLAELLETRCIAGVTTNPTIFAQAISQDPAYGPRLAEAVRTAGPEAGAEELIDLLTVADVRDACDVLRGVHERTDGVDGRVSLEVSPALAHDSEGTIEAAKRLAAAVDRENVMIKIPATEAGIYAIPRVLEAGISVNVTLVFSLDQYRKVVEAYLTGLERAREHGADLSRIASVASVFVSRVDAEIDGRLDALGTEEARALRGGAGLANCRLTHRVQSQAFGSERFRVLAAAGARVQRLLWASTGVKDPAYPDTLYVSGLVTPDTVNTMPEKTLEAFADHGEVPADTMPGSYAAADAHFDALAGLGIDYAQVMEKLQAEGLEKFSASWSELVDVVATRRSDSV
ncbi:transaldolase [Brevibacterium salitolerans]|jgi:transaldolase|uniref:Transaldolase n=1 Tax=Brevibacterium salitolerans TaxID=1403566 RepID=A0ABP5I2Z8_9MICO